MYKNFKKCKKISLVTLGVVMLLSSPRQCRAQLKATVFENFNQTIVNPYLINPAATDTSYSFKLRADNINELGIIKNVSRFYIDGDKRLNSSQENNFHFIGLQATNTKLGDYISSSRLKVRYSWFARLSQKAALSSGASLGFVNIAFLTTQGGSGGSATGPDGSIGIHYVRSNSYIGVAVQQLFTPVLIPVNQSFRLSRLYNFDVAKRFPLGSQADVTTQAVLQVSDKGSYSYNFGFLGNIHDLVLIGVNNFSLRKTSVNAGIKRISVFQAKLMLLVTYSFYHSSFPLPDNTLEIFIALQK